MNKTTEIPSLTGIRGIAALTVFAFHAGLKQLPGGFGVAVFFFLSGYLITTLLRTEIERTGSIDFRRFYERRVRRIFPPMYLILALAVLAALWAGQSLNWNTVLQQALHFTNYLRAADNSSGPVLATGAMWSLAIEEHFYLLFPFALLLLTRRHTLRATALVFAAACGATLLWRIALVGAGVTGDYIHYATDTRMDAILFGCILGLWKNPCWDRSATERQSMVFLSLSAVALVASFALPSRIFHDTLSYTIQSAALLPVFYCAVRFSHWPFFRWLEWKPVRALGLISYMFYLSHVGCLHLAKLALGAHSAWAPLAGFAGTVAFSTASYFLMERPLTKIRRKIPAPLPIGGPA